MSILSLIIAFVMNSVGTVLVKVHALRGFRLSTDIREVLTGNAFFIAALAAFAVNLVAYAIALKRMPLSVAYPVMVVASFVLVNGFSHYYFKEEIAGMQIAGYALILVGIVAVVTFARS